MHELESIGDHSDMRTNSVRHREFVVVVVQALSPVGRNFAAAQWHDAASLHFCGLFHTGHIQKRLSKIDQGNDVVVHTSGFRHSRPANCQWTAKGFFEDPALVKPAMFAEEKSLVG